MGESMKKQKGFTLMELVVTITILGIMAAVAVPNYLDLTSDAQTARCDGITGAVLSAAALQLASNKGPDTKANIAAAVTLSSGISAAAGASAGVIDITGATGCTSVNVGSLASD